MAARCFSTGLWSDRHRCAMGELTKPQDRDIGCDLGAVSRVMHSNARPRVPVQLSKDFSPLH
jgi:hypothetical protein